MKLKKTITILNKLLKEHGDIEVITSADDEWNSFHPVVFEPGVMFVEKVEHNIDTAYTEEDLKENKESQEGYIKVICLN